MYQSSTTPKNTHWITRNKLYYISVSSFDTCSSSRCIMNFSEQRVLLKQLERILYLLLISTLPPRYVLSPLHFIRVSHYPSFLPSSTPSSLSLISLTLPFIPRMASSASSTLLYRMNVKPLGLSVSLFLGVNTRVEK